MRRVAFFALPLSFLLLCLLELPMYLPAKLLPRQLFLYPAADTTSEELIEAVGGAASVLLVRGGELRRFEAGELADPGVLEAFRKAGSGSSPSSLVPSLAAIAEATAPWRRARLVVFEQLHMREISYLERLQRERRLPVELEVRAPGYDPLALAAAVTVSSQENTAGLDLLFAPKVRQYDRILIRQDGTLLRALSPDELAEGRSLHLTLPLPVDRDLELSLLLERSGGGSERRFRLAAQADQEPKILLVSERREMRSFLESQYGVHKAGLSALPGVNLLDYPLVVFDGIPIAAIPPDLSYRLAQIYKDKAASLFFVADAPSFGKKDDNPAIEEILPTELSPRSLRYLPDMGILILLDISASMMGEKLSLAKLSTLELIRNLKDSDQVSILSFWDQYRFLHGFEEKRNLDAAIELAPLIAQGGTDLYQALEEGLRSLRGLNVPQRHIIILTDGNTKEADFEALARRALLEEITLSTLAVGDDVNEELLQALARKTGGNYYRVLSLEEIPSIIFEDRKEIARASFARDTFQVLDTGGREVATVSGMSLFAPKPRSTVLYRNQFADPLLVLEKHDRVFSMMLLSDLYGNYTGEFFTQASVVRTFRAALDAILRQHRFKVRIAEAQRNLSFTVSGEALVAPWLAVYAGPAQLLALPLAEGEFQTYSASVPFAGPGRYTALLYSSGDLYARFPFYYNGNLEGLEAEARLAADGYRPLRFKVLPVRHARWLYLGAFFVTSVAVTFLSRRSPRGVRGPRPEEEP